MEMPTFISLAVYFILMLGIGLYAYRQASSSVEGYMLGGRQLSAKVTALSAGASDMSGWMLMGLPGALYLSGISAGWIAVGLVIGAYLNYLLVAPRLRVFTQVTGNAITLPDYLAKRLNAPNNLLRILASTVIVLFFTLYTSSGMVAGGKLFESAFSLNYQLGLYLTASVVVLYTLFGGFLAVSLTDFVQGCIMLLALILVPAVVIFELGGPLASVEQIQHINGNLLAPLTDAASGQSLTLLGIVSLLAWGLGYFGQPHILVRFMAIDSVNNMPAARRIGMSWMLLTIIGACATGLAGRAWIVESGQQLQDAETIFIVLSQLLFHPLIGGFLLAAILAAVMSTISSQLLVSSSALTSDLYQAFAGKQASEKQLVLAGRLSVLGVALVAVLLASNPNSNILTLVGDAWAGFGAAFGPVVLFSLFSRRLTYRAALVGMLTGALTVLVWNYAPISINGHSLPSLMYAMVPGFTLSSLSIWLLLAKTQANHQAAEHFDAGQQKLAETQTNH